MTCGRSVKEKIFSFISYYILFFNTSPITCAQICSLTGHSLPNPLLTDRSLRDNHSPIARAPRSLAPRRRIRSSRAANLPSDLTRTRRRHIFRRQTRRRARRRTRRRTRRLLCSSSRRHRGIIVVPPPPFHRAAMRGKRF